MRKASLILSALILLLGLAACGKAVDSEPVDSTNPDSMAVSSNVATTTSGTIKGEPTIAGAEKPDKSTATSVRTIVSSKSSVTTSTTTKTTMPSKTAATDKGYVTVHGSEKDLKTWIYQLEDSGLLVREARFDSGKGGEAVTVVAMTDIHFPDQKGMLNVDRAMQYAEKYDQTVILGDTLDHFSQTNVTLLNTSIWQTDPQALLVLGNHESTLGAQDNRPLETRYDLLKSVWKHDVYYTSKIIKNKVMVIQLDNSQNKFWPDQVPKLQADLEKARQKGYVVLLFYHIPLRTNNKEYKRATSFYPSTQGHNFEGGLGNQDTATSQVYELITNSADVVKGAFCGHLHQNYYVEISAKTPDGKETDIPQYVVSTMTEKKGNVMKITVR